jgi:hypothetical protein
MFFLLASDGVVAELTGLVFMWVAYDTQLVAMDSSPWLEQWFLLFLLMILLNCARKVGYPCCVLHYVVGVCLCCV